MAIFRPGSSSARPRVHDETVLQLRVELAGQQPEAWRRVLVSEQIPLAELHGIIQALFGREESEQHSFRIDGVLFDAPLDDRESPHDTTATTLARLELEPSDQFEHLAESDGLRPWRHTVVVEDRFARPVGQRLPWCSVGVGASPAEEVGNPDEWSEIVAAVGAPVDAATLALLEWLPEEFDPAFFDRTSTNARLARLSRGRRSPHP